MLHHDMGTAAEHLLGVGLGVVAVGVDFLLLPLPNARPKCTAEWCAMRACLLHCASCKAGSSCPQTCTGAWADLAVSLQVSSSDCLPQPLIPLGAVLLLPADCHTGHSAAHPSSC